MKKLFFLLAFPAFFTITANAQNTTESPKPQAGNITTELNLNLFSNGISLNNILNQLKGRYFLSPNTAVRLGFNANLDNSNGGPQHIRDYTTKSRFTQISISPGIEKHFTGTNRHSPYIGTELVFVSYNTHTTMERPDGNPKKIEYKNGGINENGGITSVGYTRTGLNAVAGADYYFAEHFYAGLEVGYGLAFTKNKDAEVLMDDISTNKIKGNKHFSLGAYANNGIRIGFVF